MRFLGLEILIAAAIVCSPSFARDPAVVAKEATSEVAAELAACAAYYTIVAAGAELSLPPGKQRDDAVVAFKTSANSALVTSAQLTNPKVAEARMTLSMQSMMRQLDGNNENFSIIGVQYMLPCKDLLEAPNKRFAYWLKEKEKLADLPVVK